MLAERSYSISRIPNHAGNLIFFFQKVLAFPGMREQKIY
jgi:hypothetical protein